MRRWLGVVVGCVVVVGIWWWWRVSAHDSAPPEPGKRSEALAPVLPRWTQPITEHHGSRRLEGRVTFDGVAVAGATVTALASHGDDVLSDLSCHCDNHCGRKLLECGCPEAAGQLVELVSARTGEATPLARATSDSRGHFVLDGLDETELAIWADGAQGIAFVAGVHAGDDSLELPMVEGRMIEGLVTDPDDAPVPGALITAIFATHSRFFDAQSDATGHFRIGPVMPGHYSVVATAPGLLPENETIDEDDVARPLAFALSAPRAVSGLVRSAGQPAAGVTVKIDGMHRKRTTTSDATGHFRFDRLKPGPYDLQASGPAGRGTVAATIARRTDLSGVEIELAKGFTVTGTVLDEHGAPIAAAFASISEGNDWRSATTDVHGQFTVELSEPGTRWVTASSKGYLKNAPRMLKLVPNMEPVSITLKTAALLSGRVVDPSGRVVPTFEISATAPYGDAGSSEFNDDADDQPGARDKSIDGGFSLGVDPGPYVLHVIAKPFAPTEFTTNAPASGLVITMKAGSRIVGRVLDSDGSPLAAVRVSASGTHQAWSSTVSDKLGRFELTGLGAGEYVVNARVGEEVVGEGLAGLPSVKVTVRAGETSTIEIKARRGATVDGVVISSRGEPVSGARVWVTGSGKSDGGLDALPFSFVKTGPDGRFRFKGLPADEVQLMVNSATTASRSKATTVIAPATGVILKLDEGTSISGRVIGDDGHPLQTFKVNQRAFDTADGVFSTPMRSGEQSIGFDSQGYAQYVMVVKVKEGTNDLGDVRLSKGQVIEGRVFDAKTNESVENAFVDVGAPNSSGVVSPNFELSEASGAVRTNLEGRFHLRADSRSTLLYVRHPDFVPLVRELAANTRTIELGLERGASLEVTVSRADGSSAGTQLRVWASGPGGRLVSFTPPRPPATTWSARALTAGNWTLQAMSPTAVFQAETIKVEAAGSIAATIHEATDGVNVTVEGAQFATLFAGAVPTPLTMSDLEALGAREVRMATDGHFQHVRAGTWTLMASRVGQNGREMLLLPIEVGATAISMPLPTMGWAPLPQ